VHLIGNRRPGTNRLGLVVICGAGHRVGGDGCVGEHHRCSTARRDARDVSKRRTELVRPFSSENASVDGSRFSQPGVATRTAVSTSERRDRMWSVPFVTTEHRPPGRSTRRDSEAAARRSLMWYSMCGASTMSNVEVSNGRHVTSAFTSFTPGAEVAAAASIPFERSQPTTSMPRLHRRVRYAPLPQPTSSTRTIEFGRRSAMSSTHDTRSNGGCWCSQSRSRARRFASVRDCVGGSSDTAHLRQPQQPQGASMQSLLVRQRCPVAPAVRDPRA